MTKENDTEFIVLDVVLQWFTVSTYHFIYTDDDERCLKLYGILEYKSSVIPISFNNIQF